MPARVLLTVLLAAVAMAPATATLAQSQAASALEQHVVAVEGRFARYLRSPGGRIVGVVLEDGTQARFASGHRPHERLRRHQRVLVRADAAQGTGGYLIDARVSPMTEPEVGPDDAITQAGPQPQPVSSAKPRKRGDPFAFDVHQRRPGRAPGKAARAAAKVKAATTGRPPRRASDRRFSREEETAAP